ncbi:MAG: hypothetical protein E7066_07425 [Lentimicrobiaceae bacterium]|nr:hypothetical protein [Lentimicrobiaceae bacterium]
MVFHVLRGDMIHLSPDIIETVLNTSSTICKSHETKHYFAITMYGKNALGQVFSTDIYTSLFKKNNHSDFCFYRNEREFIKAIVNISSNDRIIFHSNPPGRGLLIINLFSLIFKKELFKKTTYICWGSDYIFGGKGIKHKLVKYINSKAFSKYRFVGAISIDDVDEVLSYHKSANVIYAPYMSMRRILKPKIHTFNDNKSVVMVSHSGWQHNNHFESFNLLKRFVGKVRVVCPLCYGDPKYIDSVIKEGNKIFGDDFTYFTELKPIDEYRRFLQSIDIFVSAAEIQTGLGAIGFSMESGSKIYVQGNLFNSLSSQNYIVHKTQSIKDMTFDQFSQPLTCEEAQFNVDNRNKILSDGSSVHQTWQMIYEL